MTLVSAATFRCALACGCLLLGGCATPPGGTGDDITPQHIASLPPLRLYRNSEGQVHHLSEEKLREKIAVESFRHHDKTPEIVTLDRTYVVVDHGWMLDLVDWSQDLFFYHDIRWEKESFDCDNFADTLKVFAFLSGAHGDHDEAQVIVGTLVTEQRETWGGVQAGGKHALNFFLSNQGFHVVEPTSGQVAHLDEYPNRHWISDLYFD